MELVLNTLLPLLAVCIIVGLYIWFLKSRKTHNDKPTDSQTTAPRQVVKSAPVVPYMESILVNFYNALKQALPEKYVIYVNVPIEKLFDVSKRPALNMVGQYADLVIFTPALMPVLVIDLFDMSIINLDRVNRIKTASKEIIRNSGIPVLDYQYVDNCNIDELRRKIANALNPLRAEK